MRTRSDAEQVTRGLIRTAETSPRAVVAKGGWTVPALPEMDARILIRSSTPNRLGYSISILARERAACIGAIQGARQGAIAIDMDRTIFKAEEFQPYDTTHTETVLFPYMTTETTVVRIDPAEETCAQLEYPARILVHRSTSIR